MRQHRSPLLWTRTSVIAAACALSVAPVMAQASAAASVLPPETGSWHIEPSPSPGTFDELDGIAAVSPHDIWAAGRFIAGGTSRALIEHSNGLAWNVDFSYGNRTMNSYLFAVASVSADDVWAVGYTDSLNYEHSHTLVVHWNGMHWRIVTDALRPGLLSGVSALSASDVWAVGEAHGGTLVEHFDGTAWNVVASSGTGSYGNSLSAVSAISPSDVWAVGQASSSEFEFESLVLHWNGSAWRAVHIPDPGVDSDLRAVSSSSDRDVWAVGEYDEQSPEGTVSYTLTEHWNGIWWKVFSTPDPTGDDLLAGVFALPGAHAWAVGSQAGKDDLIVYWNGVTWERVSGPARPHALNLLFAVSADSATDVWASGLDIDLHGFTYHTLVEHAR